MKVLISGLGSIGRRRLSHLKMLGADIILHRRQAHPESPFPVFTSLDDALAEKPDLVVVSNPSALHLNVALPAARAGCHLLIEKPLSASLKGVLELVGIVRAKGLMAFAGFDLRFDPGLQHLRRILVGSAELPFHLHAECGQALDEWRSEDYRQGMSARRELGGGVILDLIHELDYLCWLPIGAPRKVACFTSYPLDVETESSAAILLQSALGVTATVNLDYMRRPKERRCRALLPGRVVMWDHEMGVRVNDRQVYEYHPGWSRDVRLFQQTKAVVDSVRVGKPLPGLVGLEEGARSLNLALAAKESAETQKVVLL